MAILNDCPPHYRARIYELERENEMLAMNLAIVTTNNPTPASELAAANYTAHQLLKENAMLRERLAAMPNVRISQAAKL